ncbi:MAG: spore germination protein, partial [Clostridia bacterium]|nr:spore germination protein [Clostridia bacterium]
MNNFENSSFSGDYNADFSFIKDKFKNDAMLRQRVVKAGEKQVAVLFFEGMADPVKVEEFLIKPLILAKNIPENADNDYLENHIFYASGLRKNPSLLVAIEGMQSGDTLIISEFGAPMLCDTKGFPTRSIEEPGGERVLQGPREGFDETAVLNLAMSRRKIKTADLFVEKMTMGQRTATEVYICYLDSLANKGALSMLRRRLQKIDIDGVLDSNYLTEIIRDGKFSLFKTIGTTE